MKFNKLALSVMTAAALGAGVAGQARADAMAQSLLQVSNFTLFSAPATPFTVADFSQLNFSDQLTNTSNLNGLPGPVGFASTPTFAPIVDAVQSCIGTCVSPQNNFVPAPTPPVITYSRSDSLLTGAPIVVPPIPLGANASTIGESSMMGGAFGGSTSAIQLTSSFQFVLAHAANNVQIGFNANDYLRAWTSAGSLPGTLASADEHWVLTLKDAAGATLVEWDPDGGVGTGTHIGLTENADSCTLNRTVSAGPNQPNGPSSCSGAFLATVNFTLDANTPYSFAIGHSIQTQAVSVPEPGTLGLLGAGLLAVWAGRRRLMAA